MEKSWGRGLVIFVAILILCGIGGASYYFSHDEPIDNSTDSSTDDGFMGDGSSGDNLIDPIPEDGIIDLRLPSDSTGDPNGELAVRIYLPGEEPRFEEGTPVLVWLEGGFEEKGINQDFMNFSTDFMVVTFLYPGVYDDWSKLESDGVYDYRGRDCIAALKDVLLFAAGELQDSGGRTIDAFSRTPVLHDNIGMIGSSNGGNIIVATPALYGEELEGHLKYIIQWETPVSGQLATRDFGRIWMKPSMQQGEYFNPRYLGYGEQILEGDYSDLAYDSSQEYYQIFHDGDGDGKYTTRPTQSQAETPDMNSDGELSLNEDFPVDYYPGGKDGETRYYSRAATYALREYEVFGEDWPEDIASPKEADDYWDIRESVWLYEELLEKLPEVEGMVLAGERDHVQSAPDKFNIRQAFDGWLNNGAKWVQINPSPEYLDQVRPGLSERMNLPNMSPNQAPDDWAAIETYSVPEDVEKIIYQLGAVWQMMDRAENH